jgi:hypothetical protein
VPAAAHQHSAVVQQTSVCSGTPGTPAGTVMNVMSVLAVY